MFRSDFSGPTRRIVAYPTPLGCAAAYDPETNVLIALDQNGVGAQTPAAKAIPVRLEHHAPNRGTALPDLALNTVSTGP